MFRAIILLIFRSTRVCVTACGIMHYNTSCNTQSSAPQDGQNNFPKDVELTGIINKPLLLHLVGCLYYLYQWCTIKKISDNEIYLLIKYIKSILWRVAKRLSLYTGRTVPKVKPREHAFKQFKSPVLNVLTMKTVGTNGDNFKFKNYLWPGNLYTAFYFWDFWQWTFSSKFEFDIWQRKLNFCNFKTIFQLES